MESASGKVCPWKYCFELVTVNRSYMFFSPRAEERDLWVNAFHSMMNVEVKNKKFVSIYQLMKASSE